MYGVIITDFTMEYMRISGCIDVWAAEGGKVRFLKLVQHHRMAKISLFSLLFSLLPTA